MATKRRNGRVCVFLDENLPMPKLDKKNTLEVHHVKDHVKPMTRDIRVFEFLKRWAQREHTHIIFLTRDPAFEGSINYRTHRTIQIIILQRQKGVPKNLLPHMKSKPLQNLLLRMLRRFGETKPHHF